MVPLRRWHGTVGNLTGGSDRSDWHTIIYTPPVSASPRMIDKELCDLGGRLATIRTPIPSMSASAPMTP